MNRVYHIFLNILKLALQGQQLPADEAVTKDEWRQILQLAQTHNLLPLVYQAVYAHPSLDGGMALRNKVRQLVMLQTMKTQEFMQAYQLLKEADCTPVMVKGIICRRLYPQPDLRLSTDEDMLIPAEQFDKCRQILENYGMYTKTPQEQMPAEYEVPFHKQDGVLYIELHKSLFPPQSEAYGAWNDFFTNVYENAIEQDGIRTMSYTDHMLYLICHAFKHFLHSGFGIRQVCDIVMFANAYGSQIDWDRVYTCCDSINGAVFAATLFRIGEKYLTFDRDRAYLPQNWMAMATDETNMLIDLIDGGVFGSSSMSRKHSSNMTLDAVVADKQGKKAKKSLKGTLFPSADKLKTRYTYLQEKPYLLPKAWVSRGITYLAETRKAKDSSTVDALKIGSSRVDLLKEYKVIK